MKIETWSQEERVSRNKDGSWRYGNRHYFHIVASNGEIILQSEAYNSKVARNATVKLIQRTDWSQVQAAPVVAL